MQRALQTDWFGPLAITLIAIVVIGAFNPSFLSPLNIQVLLLAIAVNMLIAFSQMIIIAIGQMNLAVGAIGGLAAISFAGMMEALWARGVIPDFRAPTGIRLGLSPLSTSFAEVEAGVQAIAELLGG